MRPKLSRPVRRLVAGCACALLLVVAFDVQVTAQNAPLFLAAERGDVDAIDRLARGGADVNVTGELRYGDRTYRVSAVGAAALGWHADAARALLKHGATPPRYVVRNHNLLPYSDRELDALRDWEVVISIFRTPEVAAITRPIVERDARGTYRTHDGQSYVVDLDERGLQLAAPGGPALRFRHVVGKAFMQIVPPTAPASGRARERTAAELTMFTRFVEPLPAAERDALVEQFRDRGGIWLDFTVGEGRVLGLEIRENGPARLGGTPLIFRKVGIRPETSPLLEREVAASRVARPPMNWPSFRGPGASGVADGQSPPMTWDAEKSVNVRWSTPIPGLGHASPIVWGDRVFVTTAVSSQPNPEFRPGGLRSDNVSADRSEHEWRLIALDRGTGKIVWQRTARRGVPRGIRHLKSTFATATPVTNGTHIVAVFGSEGMYCYDFDGNLLWTKDLGVLGHFLYGFSSSPVIYQDLVIVQADTNLDRKSPTPASFIAAFDLKDGRERWRVARDEDARTTSSTPTIYEGPPAQIVANGGSRVRSYDPATGRELWSLAAPSDLVTPTPVIGHDLIYVMSGGSGSQPMFAVRPSAIGDITPGPGAERNDFVPWSSTRGGSMTPTPIVYGDYLYSINVSGIVGCYDARTGARQYLTRLEHGGSGFSASPVAADGRIYFPSEDGDVFVVRAGPSFELLATNPMGEVIMATPAVSGGTIFIRTLGRLVAVGS
jgi:outer membrane protein assembly factor BamB